MKIPLYQHLARELARYERCSQGNPTIAAHIPPRIIALVFEHMPSGAGIDNGTEFSFGLSKPNRLVFTFGYHHMNSMGSYAGWTEHMAVVTPSLEWGYDLRITGKDRNGIKDHLYEIFRAAVNTPVDDGTNMRSTVEEATDILHRIVEGNSFAEPTQWQKAMADARQFVRGQS